MRTDTDRKAKIKDSLSSANAGCLLTFVLVLGLPIASIGVFFVYMGQRTMYSQARLNETAIAVPATIVSSDVRRSTTKTGQGAGHTTTSYWADIVFNYQYQNKMWTSTKVRVVGVGGSEAAMQAIVQAYPSDAQVSAFVDPKDPATAFLEKRWSPMPYLSVAIGCLPALFVTTLGILLVGWKRPGIALVSALVVGTSAIFLMGWEGTHYLRHVPPSNRVWWDWLMFVGLAILAFGPLISVLKARQLNRLYLEAVRAR